MTAMEDSLGDMSILSSLFNADGSCCCCLVVSKGMRLVLLVITVAHLGSLPALGFRAVIAP